jgi:hypothetical protein
MQDLALIKRQRCVCRDQGFLWPLEQCQSAGAAGMRQCALRLKGECPLRRIQRPSAFIAALMEDCFAQPSVEPLRRRSNHLFEERRRVVVALLRQEDAPSPERLLAIVDGSGGRRYKRSIRLDSQQLQEGESGFRRRQRLLAFSRNGSEGAREGPVPRVVRDVDRGSHDAEQQPSEIAARLQNGSGTGLPDFWQSQSSGREDDNKHRAMAEFRLGGLWDTAFLKSR